jgi:eukaryotic-like serine/threonine-protein kinase
MPATVVLNLITGPQAPRQYLFTERARCIIGRGAGCQPQLPNDVAHQKISRHHCLLDINPPDVRIRDFGSLNGTYLNGKRIGRRSAHQRAEEGQSILFPEHDLKDGDEVRLGDSVFRVELQVPMLCGQCGADVPVTDRSGTEPRSTLCICYACLKKMADSNVDVGIEGAKLERFCSQCGRDVGQEAATNRGGNYVCKSCRANPEQMVHQLLEQATHGDVDLSAIENYEITRELGRGGMGAVYLARHKITYRHVALKVMLPSVTASKRAVAAFLREAANTQALHHPNVVQLWDAACSRGVFFMTLEFCDAGSVKNLMDHEGGPLKIDIAIKTIIQAREGLSYAHQAEIPHVRLHDGSVGLGRGLVHRDLKPHNILLSSAGKGTIAKIGDYGLSKAFDMAGLSGHTCTGMVGGTPHFMPRQQVLDFRLSRPEVDVWAMAATLYNMLTGFVPRDFSPKRDVWQTVLQSSAVPIRRRKNSIPERLAEVIDYALMDEPEIGFKSAESFRQALSKAI